MNTHVGIWIDTKKAVVIFLRGKGREIRIVKSSIEGRERIPGKKNSFQDLEFSFQILKQKRKTGRIMKYKSI